jgi:hypothetical protein
MKRLIMSLGVLAIGICCWVSFPRPAHAHGGSFSWTIDPACKNYSPTPQRWCNFLRTQIRLGASQDAFDQWNVIAEAPGPVTSVTCKTTGSNEFHFLQYMQENKPAEVPGDHYGNVATCRGWINGSDANIVITVTYK